MTDRRRFLFSIASGVTALAMPGILPARAERQTCEVPAAGAALRNTPHFPRQSVPRRSSCISCATMVRNTQT